MRFKKSSSYSNKWFASMLLFALFFQSLIQLFHIIHFEFNKDEIIKTSCVQRYAVKNCCQGSCHINTKLNVSKTSEGTESEVQPTVVFPEVFCEKQYKKQIPSDFFSVRLFTSKNVYFKTCLLSNIDPPPPKCFS